jgi:membrane glycosyltransferase
MSPVIIGLMLAVPLGFLTSFRLSNAGLLATPEDKCPPAVLIRANELAASAVSKPTGALEQLRQNAELLSRHLASLPQVGRSRSGQIDVALATARAKIEECGSFEEAVAWLDRQEVRAVLNNPAILRRILQMQDDHHLPRTSTKDEPS